MNKKIILISISVIFFTASAVGIGWMVKEEIEKGKQNQMQSPNISKEASDMRNSEENDFNKDMKNEENVTVSNKKEANRALDDMDTIVNSMGSDLTN